MGALDLRLRVSNLHFRFFIMLKIMILGNLGNDAHVRVAGQSKFVSFDVCHSEKWTDKSTGAITERSQWVSCTLDGDGGALLQYLKKGTKVFVMGELRTRVYQTRDGSYAAGVECRVRQLELCGGAKEDDRPF